MTKTAALASARELLATGVTAPPTQKASPGAPPRPPSKPPSRQGSVSKFSCRPGSRPASARRATSHSASASPADTPRDRDSAGKEEQLQPRDVFDALREVLCTGEVSKDERDEGEDDVAEGEDGAGGGDALISFAGGPDWVKELSELLTKRKGVFRLSAERPNTGEVGTGGVKQAAEELAAQRCAAPIRIRCLLGRKGSMKSVSFPLTKGDSGAAIDQQWAGFKSAFGQPSTALLFHLTNHYALIFAWREWVEGASLKRQILTSRRGQRPSAWVDFQEVRKILLGWGGYHILQLERPPGDASLALAN